MSSIVVVVLSESATEARYERHETCCSGCLPTNPREGNGFIPRAEPLGSAWLLRNSKA